MASSHNHLSTFLYLRYCNTIRLYSIYIESSSTRAYPLRKYAETIVIVSVTGIPNIRLFWYFYQALQSTHLTICRDSILRQITQDKQASSILSKEIVLSYFLVQKKASMVHGTPLLHYLSTLGLLHTRSVFALHLTKSSLQDLLEVWLSLNSGSPPS